MSKFITRDASSGRLVEEATLATSPGATAAGRVPHLDADGKLDASFMPSGVGADSFAVVASEALAAGAFVNLWNDAGALRARNADGTTTGFAADGFVRQAVAAGATAQVFFEGQNNQLTGLTVGATYYLAAGGGVTSTAPTGAGKTHQLLGKAVSATTIATEIGEPIDLA